MEIPIQNQSLKFLLEKVGKRLNLKPMEQLQATKKQKPQELPIFNITAEGFQELQKAGLTLDQLFYLECVSNEVNLKDVVSKDKLLTWRQSLLRKGFITEDNRSTLDGETVLHSVGSGEPFRNTLEKKGITDEEDFERWWRTYPANDIFEYKGRKFDGSRALKRNKPECKEKFIKIINEGQYTAEDMICVLEFEVLIKKERSVKENANNMRYMTNTVSYLNQRLFEGLMEASKAIKAPSQTFEDI